MLCSSSLSSAFRSNNIPEINDLLIHEPHRGHGYGKQLIATFEQIAKDLGYSKIGLGVGLYKDYGRAQRLYIQMGYIPDGNGITYKNEYVIADEFYPVDDDLLYWLTKNL